MYFCPDSLRTVWNFSRNNSLSIIILYLLKINSFNVCVMVDPLFCIRSLELRLKFFQKIFCAGLQLGPDYVFACRPHMIKTEISESGLILGRTRGWGDVDAIPCRDFLIFLNSKLYMWLKLSVTVHSFVFRIVVVGKRSLTRSPLRRFIPK